MRLIIGDALTELGNLPAESVHCCVTSPPYYGLRDYGVAGQIGLEASPDAYIAALVAVFREVRRVLRRDATLWLNVGDSYNAGRDGGHAGGLKQASLARHDGINRSGANVVGLKPKDLIGIPWLLAFALRADGWYLRQDIIWAKPNPMPESVTDRCTGAHEYLFLLSRSERYRYDAAAIAEPFADERMGNPGVYKRTTSKAKGAVNDRQDLGFLNNGDGWNADGSAVSRNKRSVWVINSSPFSQAHFATFPPALIEPCILAGCPRGGTVLDPFGGAGTTGLVADRLGRNAILIELNPKYAAMAQRRIVNDAPLFNASLFAAARQ